MVEGTVKSSSVHNNGRKNKHTGSSKMKEYENEKSIIIPRPVGFLVEL
jgi:hypothetical protein